MNYTQHYQFNQWEASDKVQRTDFNADNAKIDAAIRGVAQRAEEIAAAIPKVALGTYTGNGAETRLIPLPFPPKAVMVVSQEGRMRYNFSSSSYYTYGGLALAGSPAMDSTGKAAVAIQPDGFQVAYRNYEDSAHVHHYTFTNKRSKGYHYIALG